MLLNYATIVWGSQNLTVSNLDYLEISVLKSGAEWLTLFANPHIHTPVVTMSWTPGGRIGSDSVQGRLATEAARDRGRTSNG